MDQNIWGNNFKMEEILVSVIIPTYRRSVEFLSRAVDSVRKQTYGNIEIIIVDDSTALFSGRKDIEAYIATIADDRINYYQNESNLGGSLSRNRGIQLSKGEYITFLDDDDEYLPEKIEKQLEFMRRSGCDLSFENMVMYSNKGNVVDFREYKDIPAFDNDTLLKYHLMKHLTGTPTFMFRAEKLKEIGGFDDATMGQEFYLMLKAIQNGLKIGYSSQCNVKVYRHNQEAISTGRNKINGEKALFAYKKRYFGQLDRFEKRYIRFRHYIVMAVAYKRNHMALKAVGSVMLAFVVAPITFIKEVLGFCSKIINHR
ncbi:MAG: glycosyltransferase [Clostridia bacterium]|nr:glycosyltransferase [Clostridia bacterium]